MMDESEVNYELIVVVVVAVVAVVCVVGVIVAAFYSYQ